MPRKSPTSRYRTSAGVEGIHQPGSRGRVRLNKQGIIDKRVMDQAEAVALLEAQHKYVGLITAETIFTTGLLCLMHRDWLGRLYVWAGDYRTVEMSKGRFVWPPAHLVAQNMSMIEHDTLRRCTPCRAGPTDEVAARMAEVQAEILMVHPFREGNGRLARWVTDLMALQAGHPIPIYGFDRAGVGQAGKAYLAAVVRGYAKDYAALARLLDEALRRADAERRPSAKNRTPRAPSK